MRIIGCDLHARQQTIAMLDSDTGELEDKTLEHQCETVREFYSDCLVRFWWDRSDRLDAVVPGIDGGVGDRMPSRSSPEDPQSGDASKNMIGGMHDCC
jgi:hypothetical protein